MKAMSGRVESARYRRLPIKASLSCVYVSSGSVSFSVVFRMSLAIGDFAGLASDSPYFMRSCLMYEGCDILMASGVRVTFQPNM